MVSRSLKSYRRKKGLPVDAPPGAFQRRGERAAKSKLTQEQVDEIRRVRKKNGASCAVLASKYGVTRQAIHSIVTLRSWRPQISLDDFEG